MSTTVMGAETECLLGVSSKSYRSQLGPIALQAIQSLPKIIPGLPSKEAPVNAPGMMLANGSRIYIDGNFYVENATSEALSPRDVVACQRAGERIILQAVSDAASKLGIPSSAVHLTRAVTDYRGHFCGFHVNVLARIHGIQELASSLIPFLVTRFYAAAGGWGPSGLVMTHKSPAIRCETSNDTRQNRGIINLKAESLAGGPLKRIHITHGDATMSELGTYLSVGCTALLIKMLDDGCSVGPAMKLADPVAALQQMDQDLAWNQPLPLACGLEASPVQIQEHFLKAAERYVSLAGEDWSRDVVTRWRECLEKLKQGPGHLASTLDPFIKMKFYDRILRQSGSSLEDFSAWCPVLWLIQPYLDSAKIPRRGVREYCRDHIPWVSFSLMEDRMEKHRLAWVDLPKAWQLWHQMLVTDLSYHQVDETGLYWKLRSHGLVDSRVVSDEEVRQAMMHAPRGTRAQAREVAIRESFGRSGVWASWVTVNCSDRQAHFPDPLSTQLTWQPVRPRTR